MKKALLIISTVMFFQFFAHAQLRIAGYGGLAIPAAANTSYSVSMGSIFGGQLLYEISSVEGLSVGVEVDYISGKGADVNTYGFIPATVGVNYVWQFDPSCGLSTHIGIGFNYRDVNLIVGDDDKGISFAYHVGLDLLLARHFSLGFRWSGLGNASAYESVPVERDANGNVTRYEQHRTSSNEFSLGFFTLIAGIRL